MKRILLLMAVLLPLVSVCQVYNVTLIPDSLLKNANFVQRINETKIIIHSIGSATVKTRYAYTVLNEKGNDEAGYVCFYDNFQRLTEVSGKLYDAAGNQVRSTRKKEMEDNAYDDHFSLIGDARIKSHNFYCRSYPYTVEYEQEVELRGIYQFPTWQPIDGTGYSVQKSIFYIEMPLNYELRYKLLNGAKEPVITSNNKTKTMLWEAGNFNALEYEPYQPSIKSFTAAVLIGPTDFEYGGYTGNLSSWNNYGKFYNTLNKGRDALPDETRRQVHLLTDGITDKEQKIKILYGFLQQNTHYISIQLGIGGLQTLEAGFVAEKKYGDCKALSNYMVSLLKEAGIKANCAIIYGGHGNREFYEDFPKDYFNHVVAIIPGDKDSIWLECTSQSESPGYAGSFTGNRKALLITDDGGQLVNTPCYYAADNLQSRKIVAGIDENGNLTADVNTHFTGLQQELQHELLNGANADQRKKYLNSKLNLPTYKVDKIEYRETKGRIPAMDEHLAITAENYATITGKRLFIVPNLFNKASRVSADDKRSFPIEIKDAYRDIDSISIMIPAGYATESIPNDININNKFGRYSISYKIKNNLIELARIREQDKATFPANDYNELANYFDAIYKADRAKIVLLKAGN